MPNLDAAESGSSVPCYHPLPAQRTVSGNILMGTPTTRGALALDLPCGSCIGCRTSQARGWALRCQLELEQHNRAAWANLSYSGEHLERNNLAPKGTLRRHDLQTFLRSVRKKLSPWRKRKLGATRSIRFFGSGEYGETNARPHYHVVLYGVDHQSEAELLHDTWGKGLTLITAVTPANIAYTAGYTAKKLGWQAMAKQEIIDRETGEIHTWSPPFLQMSRRPGIGAAARQFINSWRLYAVANGHKLPVPRYLHNAWLAQASPIDREELLLEKLIMANKRDVSDKALKAMEQIALAKQSLAGQKRQL